MSVVAGTSRPLEDGLQGAYLTYDCASHGTLVLTWDKKGVPDSLAYFNPKKPVPSFKYSTNGGRSNLMTKVQTDHRKYYQGVCAFLKTAKTYDGEITTMNSGPKPIAVYLHLVNGNAVVKCLRNTSYSLAGVDTVAVVPAESTEFDCKTLTSNLFREKGDRLGAALTLI